MNKSLYMRNPPDKTVSICAKRAVGTSISPSMLLKELEEYKSYLINTYPVEIDDDSIEITVGYVPDSDNWDNDCNSELIYFIYNGTMDNPTYDNELEVYNKWLVEYEEQEKDRQAAQAARDEKRAKKQEESAIRFANRISEMMKDQHMTDSEKSKMINKMMKSRK